MRSARQLRITIADDQPIFRLGVRTLLARQPDFEVVGETDNAASALELVRTLNPDVLLVDHHVPRLNGLEVVRQMKHGRSATRAIILTAAMPEPDIQTALSNGAWGVVLKNTTPEVLPECIRHVMQGQHWIGIESVGALVSGLRSPGTSGSSSLTQREVEIVKRVARGASNKDIAWQLKMGEQTVKNHLRRIFRKLRVANRVELALLAIEHQVALPDDPDKTT